MPAATTRSIPGGRRGSRPGSRRSRRCCGRSGCTRCSSRKSRAAPREAPASMRVLFFVEGFTDIRFLVGLSEICDLTVAVPSNAYRSSGLIDRVAASGARFRVDEIAGGRAAYQLRSLRYLWRRAGAFDVVLAQEMLRGALNATAVGVLKRVPVVTYMGISPIEYFRCRRERGQIGALAALGGELAIR